LGARRPAHPRQLWLVRQDGPAGVAPGPRPSDPRAAGGRNLMTLLDTLSPDDVVATTRTLVKLGEPPALEYALLPDTMGVCLRAEDGSPLVQIDFGTYGVLWVYRSDLRVLSAPALTDPDSTWDMYVAEARESARLRESISALTHASAPKLARAGDSG